MPRSRRTPRLRAKDEGGVGLEPSFETPSITHVKVVILGHSQVRRLAAQHDGPYDYNGNGGVEKRFNITYLTVPGATADTIKLSSQWQVAINLRPEFIYIWLGSNDLDHPQALVEDPNKLQKLAQKLYDVLVDIREATGARCRLMPVEARSNPRHLPIDEYRRMRNSINRNFQRNRAFRRQFIKVPSMSRDVEPGEVHIHSEAAKTVLRFLVRHTRLVLERDIEKTFPIQIPPRYWPNPAME